MPRRPTGNETWKDASALPEAKEADVATQKQRQAARTNIKKASSAAKSKKSLAHMPAKTKTALGKQGAAVAARKRTGGTTPKTRAELYEEAKRRGIKGRSRMGRAELARHLGRG